MRESLSTQGLAHLLTSGLLSLAVYTTPSGHFLNSFLIIESRRKTLLIDLKADDRNLNLAWLRAPGFEIIKCQVSLRVRCCERACARGKWPHESVWMFRPQPLPAPEDRHLFFGNKLPHLVELLEEEALGWAPKDAWVSQSIVLPVE